MRLIGLMGLAGAGKDSVADCLQAIRPMARAAFADALRAEIALAWGIDARVLTRRETRETPMHCLALRRCTEPAFVRFAVELADRPRVSPRQLMRRWGDWQRARDPMHYVQVAEAARIDAVFDGHVCQVWTDVRFRNEAQWIRANGGQPWRVVRPSVQQDRSHISETELDDMVADETIVNSHGLRELRITVEDLWAHMGETA